MTSFSCSTASLIASKLTAASPLASPAVAGGGASRPVAQGSICRRLAVNFPWKPPRKHPPSRVRAGCVAQTGRPGNASLLARLPWEGRLSGRVAQLTSLAEASCVQTSATSQFTKRYAPAGQPALPGDPF